MLQVFLEEDPENKYLFCGAPSGSETFCDQIMGQSGTECGKIIS